MTVTATTEYDRIEIVGTLKAVQVRKATVLKQDGKELTRTFERYVLHPDSDITNEPTEVKAVCNAAWTDAVKEAWKTYQESLSPA